MLALRVTLVLPIVWGTDHTGEVGPVRSADGTASSRHLSVQAGINIGFVYGQNNLCSRRSLKVGVLGLQHFT